MYFSFIPYGLAKVIFFSPKYSWVKGEALHFHKNIYILESFESFEFFLVMGKSKWLIAIPTPPHPQHPKKQILGNTFHVKFTRSINKYPHYGSTLF
jgi:hypothetical protein